MTDHEKAVTLTDVEWRDGEPWAIGHKADGQGFIVQLDAEHRELVPGIERERDDPSSDGLHVTLDLSEALKHPAP